MPKSDKFAFLSFAVLILLIYGSSLFGTFVFDDRGILEHWDLLSGLANLKDVALNPYWDVGDKLHRPTTLLSYAVNIVFLGGSAFSFHLVNLALYFSICVSLYTLVQRLFQNERLAYISALLFLALPIHSEVVANITGRSELLALLFSLLVFLECTKERAKWWLAGLYMFLALGSKETALATLPILVLVIWIKEGKWGRELLDKYFRPVSAVVVGTALYLFVRFFVLGPEYFSGSNAGLIENPLIEATHLDRIATSFSILWMYVQKALVPIGLCSDYSYNQIPTLSGLWHFSSTAGLLVYCGAIFAILLGLLSCRTAKWKVVSFASGFFVLGFFLVSNIAFPIGTIAGERLFFYASVGLVILLAYFLQRLDRRIFIAIVILYGLLAFSRGLVWVSEEKLFLDALNCAPQSVLSLSNAGASYYLKGDLESAEKYLERSREIKPIYSKGLNNLGLVYWKQGRVSEARELYFESLRQKHLYPGTIENMILLKLGERDEVGVLRWLRIKYPNVDDSSLHNLF